MTCRATGPGRWWGSNRPDLAILLLAALTGLGRASAEELPVLIPDLGPTGRPEHRIPPGGLASAPALFDGGPGATEILTGAEGPGSDGRSADSVAADPFSTEASDVPTILGQTIGRRQRELSGGQRLYAGISKHHILPNPLGPILEPINPARLHYGLERALGYTPRKYSRRPSPGFPEPLFFDLIRPFAALKYNGELNYLVAGFSNPRIPTLMFLEPEYVIADWHAVEMQFAYEGDRLHSYLFGYQATLGVGERFNWTHAVQVQAPVIYPGSDVVGGRVVYNYAWRPAAQHPFTFYTVLGAERIAVAAEGTGHGGGRHGMGTGMVGEHGGGEGHRLRGIWRPMIAANFFYDLSSKAWVGIENDFFVHDGHSTIAVIPQFMVHPTKHFELKVGAGYIREGPHESFTVMVRLFLLQPTPRQPCTNAHGAVRCDHGWRGGPGRLFTALLDRLYR